MPPVVLLLMAVVLIFTQFFHLVFPARLSYPRRLLLTTFAVLFGEAVAGRVFPGGPRLGELHPAWDVGLTTALQLLANRFLG